MSRQREPISINSSSIAVAGVGGLGMVALVVVIAATFPIARWLLVGGTVGGVILAAILIVRRRLGAPRTDLPITLFSNDVQGREDEDGPIQQDRGCSEHDSRQHLAIQET